MIPDNSLVRFRTQEGGPRLGLIVGAQLYDLSVLGAEYASFGAWLSAASGRVQGALAALGEVPAAASPMAPVSELSADPEAALRILKPIDDQEVWACGVTYEMSREARMRESREPTIYEKVYDAARPEIFFKATPHRVVGPGEPVAIRGDSSWNVPEPEMTLVITSQLEIVGYTIGNDMSSRDIEGQNPLYLPQAKVYDACCALGPYIRLRSQAFDPLDQAVRCTIYRGGAVGFEGTTHTSRIHRPLDDLVRYLGYCNSLPNGALVMTGTGIVPPDTFTLAAGDTVEIAFECLGTLTNPVIELPIE